MIALYILLGILGFFLLLFCLLCTFKLSVRAAYCQTALLVVGIGPFKLKLVGGEKREAGEETPQAKRPTKQKKKAKKPKKEKKASKKAAKKPAEKPPLTQVIGSFRDLLIGLLRNFTRQLKLEELRLRVLIASDDAAMTAVEYGAVCALVEPVYQAASLARRAKKDCVNVSVECDFLADKPEVDAEFCLSVRIGLLVAVAMRSTRPLIKALSLLRAYKSAAAGEKAGQTAVSSSSKTDT